MHVENYTMKKHLMERLILVIPYKSIMMIDYQDI